MSARRQLSERPIRWTESRGLRFDQQVALHLTTVFQPIVCLRRDEVFAYEVLARWHEGSPETLLEDAVAQGCMGRLGRSIRSLATYAGRGHTLFLNIHPAELVSRWLVRPDDPINTYDGRLYLEITEASAMAHFDLCKSALREIGDRTGARLVVDDFGAGYSNMVRIVELHPAVVKLDKSLVRGLPEDPRRQTVVRHLVAMCEDLGAQVVAEGVETEDERIAVVDCGVHYGQGWLFGRPKSRVPPRLPESGRHSRPQPARI